MPFLHFMIFMYSLASLLISSGFFFLSPSVFFSCQYKPLFCKHGWRRFFVVFHTEFFLHCVLKICWNIMMTSRVMEKTRKKPQNLFNRILYTAVYKFIVLFSVYWQFLSKRRVTLLDVLAIQNIDIGRLMW